MDQDLVVLEAFFGEEKHISNCMHVGICDQVSVYILHSLCLSRSPLLNNLLYFPFTLSHTNSVCFTAPVSTLFLFLRYHCCTNNVGFSFMLVLVVIILLFVVILVIFVVVVVVAWCPHCNSHFASLICARFSFHFQFHSPKN